MAENRSNSSMARKVAARVEVASSLLPGRSSVLEGFCGTGQLWRACWLSFTGLAIDKDLNLARMAAESRPTWRVLSGDTLALLEQGAGRSVPFDVVDLDCFWKPVVIHQSLVPQLQEKGLLHNPYPDRRLCCPGVYGKGGPSLVPGGREERGDPDQQQQLPGQG